MENTTDTHFPKSPETSRDNSEKVNTLNEQKIKIVVEIIQNPLVSSKEVYKGLTYIRTKVINEKDGISVLHKLDGFKPLLKLLSHKNEEVINISCSIIGNCCDKLIMEESIRDAIIATRVPERIASVLDKTTSRGIQKRLCRLIGNLAQSHVIAKELHGVKITPAVVHVLNTSQDTEVQQMSIRALRWLWEVDRHHNDMLKAGVVKAVAIHLESKNEEILKAVLRTLVKFTQHCSMLIAEQICGNGNGYQQIVGKLDLPVVPVLICNLSYSPRARIELSKAGAVESIINRLEGGKINSYLITGLCQMCRESMIRASLRITPNGFKTLLSLLMNRNTKHFYPEILDAITQFNYDQASLMMMVRVGLIGVLVEKLGEYTKAHCPGHIEAVAEEAMGPASPRSPPSSWAGSPSPQHSPHLSLSGSAASMSGPDYSPRCSTPESDSSDSPLPNLDKGERERWMMETPVGLDGCIIEVLSHLTYQGTPMMALASKTTVTTFLDYLTGLPYPRYRNNYVKAARAFISILMCKHYWNMLLNDESVLEIHRRLCRPRHEDCWECRRLGETGLNVLREIGTTAQSGLGEGEIIYRLAAVSGEVRSLTALTLPHVIRQPSLLRKLLLSHNALKILVESLSTNVDEAVAAFHSLFFTLKTENPQTPIEICNSCEIGKVRNECTVRFALDDGSIVSANKESLSHSCPVFEAMFRGGFKESTQNCIRLSDISASCLTHLTRVLHEYCTCVLPKELTVLLEMISISDRFLLPELMDKVMRVVRHSALSSQTAAHIYDWSLTVGSQFETCAGLPQDVLKYIFTASMTHQGRVAAVQEIITSQNKETFIKQLTAIVITDLDTYIKTQRFFNCYK